MVGFQAGGFAVESEKTVQVLPPAQVLAQWEQVDAEDFRVMAEFDPERLRRLAAEDPARLVERVLRVCGGRADFKQLKAMLIPVVIPAEGWSAWWNSVRVGLKRNPLIEVSEGTQPQFALRAAEVGYADRLRAAFAQADLFARVKMVLAYLAEVEAGHEGDAALAAEWGGELLRAGREAADATSALAALAAAEEVRARYSQAPDPRADLARGCRRRGTGRADPERAFGGDRARRAGIAQGRLPGPLPRAHRGGVSRRLAAAVRLDQPRADARRAAGAARGGLLEDGGDAGPVSGGVRLGLAMAAVVGGIRRRRGWTASRPPCRCWS